MSMKNNKEKQRAKINTKKIALYGMMTAAALICSYIESQIPAFFAVPGMKLGLTNIIVVLALYKMGSGSAMAINIIRIVLVSMMFGGPSAMLYSLAGGMLSTIVMIILKKTDQFNTVTVSAVGGVFHNVGQILVAMLWLKTASIGWYLMILWATGMATGILIGILGYELIRRMPDKLFK